MYFTLRVWLTCSLLVSYVVVSQAQPDFKEGFLLYKVDTLERLSANPTPFPVVQMKFYKKGDLARHEMILVDNRKPFDTLRTVQIRNANGIYICMENMKTAILMTYEEEKLDKANRAANGYPATYSVEKTGQKVSLLGILTERVLLKNADKTKPLEALVSANLDSPVTLFFESLSQVIGTPLQFSEREEDWIIRYTAIAIKSQPVASQLFDVDPGFTVITMKQMLEMGQGKK